MKNHNPATATSRTRKLHPSPYLLLVLTTLFWSGNWVVGRGMQPQMPPIAMSFWRWTAALIILLPFVWKPVVAQWELIRKSWGILLLLGILGVASFNTLAYLGLKTTTATNGLLLNSVMPVLIIAISWAFLGQRLSLRQGAGVALSMGGVLTIIAHGDLGALTRLHLNGGDLWVLAAVICWAVYTVCLRWRPRQLGAFAFLGATVIIGVAAVAPLYMWEFSTGARFEINLSTAGAIAYFGLFPSVLAYLFWNRAVAEVGANTAGLFIHLMPVFGTILSMLFLGEALHLFHGVGITLIFSGIFLTTLRRRG